jgi:lipoate-protein ligase B
MAPLVVERLGRVPYAEGWKLQEERVTARRAGDAEDTLLLLEHEPVVTLGRGSHEANLRLSREALAARGVELFEVNRGGDVTYHAPGQLVGYPVLDLDARDARDLHRYLRSLELVLCEVLDSFGVPPKLVEGRTGVFVDTGVASAPPRKIASIGVGARGWVTFHGFALNVDLDLAGFEVIVPCGLDDVEMTSIAHELGETRPDLFAETEMRVVAAFRRHFES